LLRVAAVAGFLACFLWHSVPALASGAVSFHVAEVSGPFAERVAGYSGAYGTLTVDLTVAAISFLVFAICAGSETAITTLWPWKVRELAQREQDDPLGSRMWQSLRKDIQRFMQTILIGATMSGVISTAVVTHMCGELFGPRGLTLATFSVTLSQLILCEIIPKSVAVSNAYEFAKTSLPFFYRLSFVVYPVSKFINRGVEFILRCCGISVDASKTPFVSEDELDLIFSSAMQSGVVEPQEGEMIRSVRNLDNQKVKDVMTPLVDMVCIEATAPISDLHELCMSTGHSRIPVYSQRFDSIVGIVSMKVLLRHVRTLANNSKPVLVESIMDSAFFVPETMSCLALLQYLKERTLAIVVDEYGGTTGLATLEDVLEEIVGDIHDPDDEKDKLERDRTRSSIVDMGNGIYVISAAADITDVNEVLSIAFPEGDYNSIGGFVVNHLDRLPAVGEVVLVETRKEILSLRVSDVDDRRILQLEAKREPVISATASYDEATGDLDIDLDEGPSKVLSVSLLEPGLVAQVAEVLVQAKLEAESSGSSSTSGDSAGDTDMAAPGKEAKISVEAESLVKSATSGDSAIGDAGRADPKKEAVTEGAESKTKVDITQKDDKVDLAKADLKADAANAGTTAVNPLKTPKPSATKEGADAKKDASGSRGSRGDGEKGPSSGKAKA